MESTVGDFVSLVRGTTYKGALVGEPGPALLGLGSITPGGGFRRGDFKTYGGECPDKLMLYPGDLFVSLKGATKDGEMIGSIARVPPEVSSGRITQDTVKLQFDKRASEKTFRDYLYWLLRTPQYRNYCAGRARGSAVVALSREDFLGYPVPELETSRGWIVEVLEDIDDKIEANRRMNGTLEAMARAVFWDWFVDFGPTRRQVAGASDPHAILGGMIHDSEEAIRLAALFPATFGDNGLPEGWESGTVGDLFTLQRGFDLPAKSRIAGPYSVVAASGVHGSHIEAKVEGPGVVTGRSGVIGEVQFLHEDFWPLNTTLWVKEFKVSTPLHCYFYLKEMDLNSINSGSAVPSLNRNYVHSVSAPLPNGAIVRAFDEIASSMFGVMNHGEAENRTLAATRDLPLPKLMSGEIRLKDAKAMV